MWWELKFMSFYSRLHFRRRVNKSEVFELMILWEIFPLLSVTYTIHKHIHFHLHYYTLIKIWCVYILNFLSKPYSDMMKLRLARAPRKKTKKNKTSNVTAVWVKRATQSGREVKKINKWNKWRLWKSAGATQTQLGRVGIMASCLT